MLGIFAIGGLIAYHGAEQSEVIAHEIPIYRNIGILSPERPIINIDLNSRQIQLEGTPTAEVNINDEIRTIVKWKTKVVEKEVTNHPEINLNRLLKLEAVSFDLPETIYPDKLEAR
jgi:hypothetical protein